MLMHSKKCFVVKLVIKNIFDVDMPHLEIMTSKNFSLESKHLVLRKSYRED